MRKTTMALDRVTTTMVCDQTNCKHGAGSVAKNNGDQRRHSRSVALLSGRAEPLRTGCACDSDKFIGEGENDCESLKPARHATESGQ
jgi:hypothetical protein